ncbi:dinuclear metal center YbgI/SA1388 family protein [Aurantimicrobium minutum]|uniref:Nif3-like dinuclear metal center hexameric protein n=1 Tax=Aurantimicrobium minutum TaxID=708131 RepID=UPI002472FF5D|nr:Nif3-like dinuclear metal center hexameric protein [Aurantimicrobium minutum]MDH6533063.1 dinuclear metal center YbgI/SA1388 family protein [Aurantimicrobium minutum]
MTILRDVVHYAHTLWPLSGAEEWDAPGLVSGNLDQPVKRILLAVDAVSSTVEQALDVQADLLLTHHPLLMRGVTSVAEERYKGKLIGQLIRGNVALLAAHTNADVVEQGVSDVIARHLGLQDTSPLAPGSAPGTGIGRVGNLSQSLTLGALARQLAELLPNTAGGVKVSGDFNAVVNRVSLCGGAGDSLLSTEAVVGSDVYITSDLRHHPAQEAREQACVTGGPALIDVSHWASEWLWLDVAATQLKTEFPDIEVDVSDLRTDPWDFLVVQ